MGGLNPFFQNVGIHFKKVDIESLAYCQKLLGVNGRFEKYLLHSSRMDIDAFGKPLVSVPLSTQLFSYYLPYRYIHKTTVQYFKGASSCSK